MPRTEPTMKLDVIGNFDLKPEKGVENYFESKIHQEKFPKPEYTNSSGETLESIAAEQSKELNFLRDEQKFSLEQSKEQRILNSKRIQEMYKLQLAIKRKFVAVGDFIRSCEEKERAANEKIKTEMKIQAQLKTCIDKCKRTILELDKFKASLAATIKEMEPYERVIEEVVKKVDMVKSVKSCTDRCDSLMLAQVEIMELEQQLMKTIDGMRKEMITATNAAALTVLGLNNELAELERSYTNARNQAFHFEEIIGRTTDTILSNELKQARILDALQHLTKLLCKRRGIEDSFARNDIEGQLDFVGHELEILSAVIILCRQEQKTKVIKAKTRRRFRRRS